jgi:hypothetical protein
MAKFVQPVPQEPIILENSSNELVKSASPESEDFNIDEHNKNVLNDTLQAIRNNTPNKEEPPSEVPKEKLVKLYTLLKLMGYIND